MGTLLEGHLTPLGAGIGDRVIEETMAAGFQADYQDAGAVSKIVNRYFRALAIASHAQVKKDFNAGMQVTMEDILSWTRNDSGDRGFIAILFNPRIPTDMAEAFAVENARRRNDPTWPGDPLYIEHHKYKDYVDTYETMMSLTLATSEAHVNRRARAHYLVVEDNKKYIDRMERANTNQRLTRLISSMKNIHKILEGLVSGGLLACAANNHHLLPQGAVLRNVLKFSDVMAGVALGMDMLRPSRLASSVAAGSAQALAATGFSHVGRAVTETVLFKIPWVWEKLVDSHPNTDPDFDLKATRYLLGLQSLASGWDQLNMGFITVEKVPAYTDHLSLWQARDLYGSTEVGVLFGTFLSLLVTALSMVEFRGAEQLASTVSKKPSSILDVKDFLLSMLAGFLGGVGGTLQLHARMPFFPGPMLSAVIGAILKDVLNAVTSTIRGAIGFLVLPRVLLDAMEFLGNVFFEAFFQWQVPFIGMTPFEFTLTLLLVGPLEIFFDIVIGPFANAIASQVENFVFDELVNFYLDLILPEDVKLLHAYAEGTNYFRTGLLPWIFEDVDSTKFPHLLTMDEASGLRSGPYGGYQGPIYFGAGSGVVNWLFLK